MGWLRWLIGFAALVLMVYACALPGDLSVGRDDDGGLSGIYTINGLGPDGAEYSGTLTLIDTDQPRIFTVQWLVTGARQEGTAELRGTTLTTTWDVVDNATGIGTGPIVYAVAPDGSMTGTWTAEGFESPGREDVLPEP